MKRRNFLSTLAILPLAGMASQIENIFPFSLAMNTSETMPVLFLGHGSPMNALETNEFTLNFQRLGKRIPLPKAILCISAHWETKGTFVTGMTNPKTIHDFSGFPQKLFDVEYPAPGSVEVASEAKNSVKKTVVGLDQQWGLDHGCWSVLTHLYPKANVPVVQLSLDYSRDAQYHYELAKELAVLRNKGVLIIGSGNIVHNLGMIDWRNQNNGYDWALEADNKVKELIQKNDHASLIHYEKLWKFMSLAVPSPEHYLPLLYCLALKQANEKVNIFNDKAVMGSLTMTSVSIGE
ncbi:MAG: 4,5-DOPA dioxygenase extradiol [Bacteroidota bacterium]